MPLDPSGKMSVASQDSSYWIEEDSKETPKSKCWLWNFYSSRACIGYFSPHSTSSVFAISPLTDKPSPPTCKCLVCVCSHPHITESKRKDRGHVCTQRQQHFVPSLEYCQICGWKKGKRKKWTCCL